MTRTRGFNTPKRSNAVKNRNAAPNHDALVEEVKQLQAALSIYRHLVDRLTQQLISEGVR